MTSTTEYNEPSTIGGETTQETSYPETHMFAVSEEFYDIFSVVVNFSFSPIICVFGLIGNITGLNVLLKDPTQKKLTIYTYMFSLMAFDIVFLVVGLVLFAIDVIGLFDVTLYKTIKDRTTYLTMKGYTLIVLKHIAAVLLIIMSVERLLSLTHPFTIKSFCLARFPRAIVAVVSVVSCVYIIPFFLGRETVFLKTEFNETISMRTVNAKYFPIFFVYTFIETIILHYVCPLLLLVLNILIVVQYTRHMIQRKTLQTNRVPTKSQVKITTVVLCVAGLYILLSLPNMFLQTLILVDEDYAFYGSQKFTFYLFVELGDLFARINASADFFIYILVSNRYRRVFKTLFCTCGFRGFQRELYSQSSRERSFMDSGDGKPAKALSIKEHKSD